MILYLDKMFINRIIDDFNIISFFSFQGTLAEDDSIYMSLGELSMPDFY